MYSIKQNQAKSEKKVFMNVSYQEILAVKICFLESEIQRKKKKKGHLIEIPEWKKLHVMENPCPPHGVVGQQLQTAHFLVLRSLTNPFFAILINVKKLTHPSSIICVNITFYSKFFLI